eukprot:1103210-Prymnesium_polylepis.1
MVDFLGCNPRLRASLLDDRTVAIVFWRRDEWRCRLVARDCSNRVLEARRVEGSIGSSGDLTFAVRTFNIVWHASDTTDVASDVALDGHADGAIGIVPQHV